MDDVIAVLLDMRARQHRCPAAEAAIDFLQRDDSASISCNTARMRSGS